MNFREMPPLKVAIITKYADYNQTLMCLKRGLDIEIKRTCSNMSGLWPNAVGAMQFFQVSTTTKASYIK
jgi:hypothetical protein